MVFVAVFKMSSLATKPMTYQQAMAALAARELVDPLSLEGLGAAVLCTGAKALYYLLEIGLPTAPAVLRGASNGIDRYLRHILAFGTAEEEGWIVVSLEAMLDATVALETPGSLKDEEIVSLLDRLAIAYLHLKILTVAARTPPLPMRSKFFANSTSSKSFN